MASDDELIGRAKAGDTAAWEELYALHAGRLVVWLRLRPLGDAAVEPDDIAGETWLVAASKISDFRGSASDFGGWIFGIARKIAATSRRTAERRATSPTGEPGDYVDDHVTDHAHLHAQLDGVRGLLDVLSPSERDAVALVDCLGLDSRTAAEALGVSSVALRVARHRGLRRLSRASRTQVLLGEISTT